MKPSVFDFVVVDPSDEHIERWFRPYAKKAGLGDVPVAGDEWYGLSLGGELRAVAGEHKIRNDSIKLTNLLAEPSRIGLEAMNEMLAMYVDLARHGTIPFIGADILASSHAIKRRAFAAGFRPYSEVWYVGSLDAMR